MGAHRISLSLNMMHFKNTFLYLPAICKMRYLWEEKFVSCSSIYFSRSTLLVQALYYVNCASDAHTFSFKSIGVRHIKGGNYPLIESSSLK